MHGGDRRHHRPGLENRAHSREAGGQLIELGIVTLGHVHSEDLSALTTRFTRLEQLVLDIAPRDSLSAHRAELNRAIDAASTDWILIVREREVIGEALAQEIATAVFEGKAGGFRIRSVPLYRGRPLQFGNERSEIRLFHRRHYLRNADKGQWQEMLIQGTVVRLQNVLQSVTFASSAEHRATVRGAGPAVALPARLLRFVSDAVGTRTLDPNTLAYIWIESAVRRV